MKATRQRGGEALGATDAQLLARVARGERDALGVIFERHGNEIYRFARRLARDQDADEIVQLVFLRVGEIAQRYDAPDRSARSWIFGIAVRVIADRRRSHLRMRNALAAFARFLEGEETPPGPGVRPDLERALATLSAPTRETFLLVEAHGFTGDEVAEMQSIPVGTVWRRLHDARVALRKRLGGEP